MVKRTTLEIDQGLLERARRALGRRTTRATVEEALRRATVEAEDQQANHVAKQQAFLASLASRIDVPVLMSEEMWG
jgi:Arc/MetJ family transcription regulator